MTVKAVAQWPRAMVWHNRSWSVYGHWASLVLRVAQETIGIRTAVIPSLSVYCPYIVHILPIYCLDIVSSYIQIDSELLLWFFDVHQGSGLSTMSHCCLANKARLVIFQWGACIEHMYRTMRIASRKTLHRDVHTYIYIYICMYVRTYVCMYVCIHTRIRHHAIHLCSWCNRALRRSQTRPSLVPNEALAHISFHNAAVRIINHLVDPIISMMKLYGWWFIIWGYHFNQNINGAEPRTQF